MVVPDIRGMGVTCVKEETYFVFGIAGAETHKIVIRKHFVSIEHAFYEEKKMDLTGKKLMILGASRSQLPLIRAAKRLGVRTVVCSTPGNWPGFGEGDDPVLCDISDPDQVLETARQFSIDGITTCCMDIGVAAMGKVCSAMGLCGISEKAALTARDKAKMKASFLSGGVRTARFFIVRTSEELERAMESLPFPIVVKAVNLMGSRGIFLCRDKEEGRQAFTSAVDASGADYVLAEEFLAGTLFDGEAMIQNGELVYTLLDNTEVVQSHVPTSIGHSIPFLEEESAGEDARHQIELAAASLGLDNSALDFDLMLKDGKVYVIEVNARAGASCLPEIVGCRYGIDYYEALVRLALGDEVKGMFSHPDEGKACLARILTSKEDGIVRKMECRETILHDAELIDLSFDIRPGDRVRVYTNGRDRIGQIILTGKSLAACEQAKDLLMQSICLEVEKER